MPRNSFVQMNKLTNVSGRITYISSKAKQENLYATYSTVQERSFWSELAKCNQESFRQSGTEGKCIEARELIIALPESFVYYEPEYLLRRFTDHFKRNYKVECISALHHNKRKNNYHIHLIFAERQLLDKPIEKIATRNMFYDEKGKHRRTKKIGKNNPKATEIEADNMERVRWNQAVDRALISGVAEEDILGVKREKISEAVKRSIELYGNNPSFLVGIIRLAIKELELLISKVLLAVAKVVEKIVDVVHEKVVEKEVPALKEEPEQAVVVQDEIQFPKKPEEPLLLSKYPVIMELDAELKRRNEEIFAVEQERGNLEIELSECSGVFKKKQRKEFQERISLLDKKVEKMKTELSKVLRDAGYANAAEFFTELFAVREEKRKYAEACMAWQEECVKAETEAAKGGQYFGDVSSLERGRSR